MYHYQCDWCGERIDEDGQYVEMAIEIVTGERDHLGRPQNEGEPTRFFHVTPLRSKAEWDRLGLDIEVGSKNLGDCCYTRALRAIEGHDFDAPDAGLEWRLMPVGGDADERPRALSDSRGPGNFTPPPKPVEADADLEAFLATLASGPRQTLHRKLNQQGVASLEQLEASGPTW